MGRRVSIRTRWPIQAGRSCQRKCDRWRTATFRRLSLTRTYWRAGCGAGATADASLAMAVARNPRLNLTSCSSNGSRKWWKAPLASMRSQSTVQRKREQSTILARGYNRRASSMGRKSSPSTWQKTARTSPAPESGSSAAATCTSQSKPLASAATSTRCQLKSPARRRTGRRLELRFEKGCVPFMVCGIDSNWTAKRNASGMEGMVSEYDILTNRKPNSRCRYR